MGKCKICHVEAELTDGRCHSCRMAKEATDHHMTYGKYVAMIAPPVPQTRNCRSPETKKCKWCGGEFIPVRKNQTYCCTECARYDGSDRPQDIAEDRARPKKVIAPKICAECGREFVPIRNDAKLKFCSRACSTKAGNRAKVEKRRAMREQKRLLAEASADTASMA